MATDPQYELGSLVGGTWRQSATALGQDYYENIGTGGTQYGIPLGWEDAATDGWVVDGSRTWPQWRNTRTGRIRRTNPTPPAPRTYLDKANVQTHLQLVERAPESHEYMYRRVMMAVLKYFFLEEEGFDILQEKSRGETEQGRSIPDMAVLKIMARPGGSTYAYDYCLVESKRAGMNWDEASYQLGRHCQGTDNASRRVYGIANIGLYVQFFTAHMGSLTRLSGSLHMRGDVDTITAMFNDMKRHPLPFHD